MSTQSQAQRAYANKLRHIRAQLAALEQGLAAHADEEIDDWTRVADLGRVSEGLSELLAFLDVSEPA